MGGSLALQVFPSMEWAKYGVGTQSWFASLDFQANKSLHPAYLLETWRLNQSNRSQTRLAFTQAAHFRQSSSTSDRPS
eukprot:1149744-Pelagomonas_calceolata.AAC.10